MLTMRTSRRSNPREGPSLEPLLSDQRMEAVPEGAQLGGAGPGSEARSSAEQQRGPSQREAPPGNGGAGQVAGQSPQRPHPPVSPFTTPSTRAAWESAAGGLGWMLYGLLRLLALPHSKSGEVHRPVGFKYPGLPACWGCLHCLTLGLARSRLALAQNMWACERCTSSAVGCYTQASRS